MFYKNKVKAMTSIEVLVVITIISIFAVVIFPILKVNNRMNSILYFQSIIDKNKGDIIKIIENSIESSQNYWSIENFNDSVVVLNYNRRLPKYIDKNFFCNKRDKGNLIFIKIPILKNEKVLRTFLVFYLYRNSLYIFQGEYIGNFWYIEDENIFTKNIAGYFKKMERGVFINLIFKRGRITEEVKGYENFKK